MAFKLRLHAAPAAAMLEELAERPENRVGGGDQRAGHAEFAASSRFAREVEAGNEYRNPGQYRRHERMKPDIHPVEHWRLLPRHRGGSWA